MIDIIRLESSTPKQASQITALYRLNGWWGLGPDDPELVRRIVVGSHHFLVACRQDHIIGMGRAISDRVSDAYIQDVTVAPEYRHRGIGSQLIQTLTTLLKADGIDWIGLIAERHSHPFYRRIGFTVMPDAKPMLNRTP